MAESITIDKVRTQQIVISVNYNDAGAATGATLSATGHKLSDGGDVIASLEKSWEYANLGAAIKADIKNLVQKATLSMSQEIGETDEVVLS